MPQVQTHTQAVYSVCLSTGQKKNKANNSIGCHKLPPQPPSPPAGGYSIDIYLFQLHFLCLPPPLSSANPKHKFNLQNVLRSFASPTPTLDTSTRATLNPTAASAVYQSSGQRTERKKKSIAASSDIPPYPSSPFPSLAPALLLLLAWSMRLTLVAVVCWQINEEICKLSKLNAL